MKFIVVCGGSSVVEFHPGSVDSRFLVSGLLAPWYEGRFWRRVWLGRGWVAPRVLRTSRLSERAYKRVRIPCCPQLFEGLARKYGLLLQPVRIVGWLVRMRAFFCRLDAG